MYSLYTSGSVFYFIRDLGEIMKVLRAVNVCELHKRKAEDVHPRLTM